MKFGARFGGRLGGRVVGFALAMALIASGLGWEATHRTAQASSSNNAAPRSAAMLAPVGASGAVWFCPLAASTSGVGGAALRISSFNPVSPGTKETNIRVSLHGPAGEIVSAPFQLGPLGLVLGITDLLQLVPGIDLQTLPSMAATVESESDPSIVVESSLGDRSSGFVSCATSVSPQWFLADGSTALGSTTELSLFNPFPGPALVDLQFWTDRGPARPTALQGVAVPAGAVRVIEIGEFVRRRDRVATEVTVRSGRVVVAENLSVAQGAQGARQSELVVATPSLASTWFVPAAIWSGSRSESFTVVNPSDRDVTLEIAATLSPTDVEPFELIVPAGSTAVFDPADEAGRIPEKTRYAAVFNVTSGADVLVGRSSRNTGKAAARLRTAAASPNTSSAWVVANDPSSLITVFNPYEANAKVSVTFGKTNVVSPFTVAAGSFQSVKVPAKLPVNVSQNVSSTDSANPAGASLVVSSVGADVVVSQSGRSTASTSETKVDVIAVGR